MKTFIHCLITIIVSWSYVGAQVNTGTAELSVPVASPVACESSFSLHFDCILQVLHKGHLRARELSSHIKELTRPCTLYNRFTLHSDSGDEEGWYCQLDPADGVAYVTVPDLDLTNATSGETTLFAPGIAVIGGGFVFPDHSEIVFGKATDCPIMTCMLVTTKCVAVTARATLEVPTTKGKRATHFEYWVCTL
jgi:hypothetical protein